MNFKIILLNYPLTKISANWNAFHVISLYRCAKEAVKLQIFSKAGGWGLDILWQMWHFSDKAFAEANGAARFKQAALVWSQAGRATEPYLIWTIPETAVVFTLTEESRWHQTHTPQSRVEMRQLWCPECWEPQPGLWEFTFWILDQKDTILLDKIKSKV